MRAALRRQRPHPSPRATIAAKKVVPSRPISAVGEVPLAPSTIRTNRTMVDPVVRSTSVVDVRVGANA